MKIDSEISKLLGFEFLFKKKKKKKKKTIMKTAIFVS